MTAPGDVPVTQVVGEDAEGRVLQALAGEGNMYVMVIFEFGEGENGTELNVRVPSNASDVRTLKAMLTRAAGML